jgi:hypothetical protein
MKLFSSCGRDALDYRPAAEVGQHARSAVHREGAAPHVRILAAKSAHIGR